MKQIICFFFALTPFVIFSQEIPLSDKNEITLVLQNQQKAWNNGDIDGYMEGYWKSDSLKFIGKKGLTLGWENTLNNYKKSYPGKEAMGKLFFEMISFESLGNDVALVIGKWELKREKDNPNGYFSLIWKRVGGRWVIVADHSS